MRNKLACLDATCGVADGTILVRGERLSGTNYMQALLSLNYGHEAMRAISTVGYVAQCKPESAAHNDACCLKWGVQETQQCPLALFQPPPQFTVVVMRSPYAWLPRMFQNTIVPYTAKLRRPPPSQSFSAFLRAPFPTTVFADGVEWRAEEGGKKAPHCADGACDTPVSLWLAIARTYANLKSPKLLVSLDDGYSKRALNATLLPALESAGYKRKHTELQLPLQSSGMEMRDRKVFTAPEYEKERMRIKKRNWLRWYSRSTLDFVNTLLEEDLMNAFGFETVRAGWGKERIVSGKARQCQSCTFSPGRCSKNWC